MLQVLLHGFVGAVLVLVVVGVLYLNGRPDLGVWHTARLDAEFHADSGLASFGDYLALEDRLFAQLEERVFDRLEPADRSPINRFHRGSLSDPGRWPRNWNRSFELTAEGPEGPRLGVLLVHGMSDSPYSLRSLGERVHEEGAHVLGLRVPGHGTAPSGLLRVTWQDMAAAVRLAMRHLREKVGERPLVILGYSNGGALAVEYSLEALDDPALPLPDGLILLSPEIGLSRLAALAQWQGRLGRVLGLEKLAWHSIRPELDPFKYGSFALNAGRQAYLITREIKARLQSLGAGGGLGRFPRTLAFQSVADATVSAPALVTGLFDHLPSAGHEVVLFDINRSTHIEAILKRDPDAWLRDILRDADNSFAVGVVTNESEEESSVLLRRRAPDEQGVTETRLGLSWPQGVYSLAHISLPFRPDDPLYGGPEAGESPGIQLGNIALRGERGVLRVGASEILRLRWNPFHGLVESRVLDFVSELTSGQAGMVHIE